MAWKFQIAIFAFNGDPMCFMHVLLNALDMAEKGHIVKLIIEGSATKLVQTLAEPGQGQPFAALYERVKAQGLIECVCRACAGKMGALEAAEAQGLPLCAEMSGHPSMSKYIPNHKILIF